MLKFNGSIAAKRCKFMSIFKKNTVKLEVEAVEPERVSKSTPAQKLLWYPDAVIEPSGTKMTTRGTYRKGYPEGCVVHWTSGWSEGRGMSAKQHAVNAAKYGAKTGMCYFLIDREGVVYQCAPLDKWGYHAGTSSHPKLGTSVSRYLVGIEVMASGTMKKQGDKWVSWFGHAVSDSEVRTSGKKDNIAAGTYHKFTVAQEGALKDLILWLKRNNPDVFDLDLVIDHAEASPGRKVDVGAALSMTMPEFREYLKKHV